MSSKWVDLSHDFYEGMPYNKLLDPPKIDRVYTLDDHLFQLTRYTFFTHLSTHMDSPCHFVRGGKTIEEITPEESSGSAVVWNVPKPAFGEITVQDLEKAGPKARAGDMVFLRTGWGAKFDLHEYHDHPYLTDESSQWLVDKGIKLVGVDFITVSIVPPTRLCWAMTFSSWRTFIWKK
jgi:kynurenine formamidase